MMNKVGSLLQKFLKLKRKANSSYSLRALARDLSLSPSYLSRVLSGEKRLAYNRLERAAEILNIDEHTLTEIKESYLPEDVRPGARSKTGKGKKRFLSEKYKYADRKEFAVLRVWYYLAILDLTTCSNFDGTEEEIAARLGLHRETAQIAVRELLEVGLLTRMDGRLKKSTNRIRLSSANSQESIRGFHAQMLERARRELTKTDRTSFNDREISGLIFAANKKKLRAAKKMLLENLHEVAEFLSEGETTEVYHLGIQLFPLSRSKSAR
jgi:uncharacterized protein (TIGR02147 family)